jgi:hypothetical protein
MCSGVAYDPRTEEQNFPRYFKPFGRNGNAMCVTAKAAVAVLKIWVL